VSRQAQEIQMFFQILDTGGDGVLQYQEFFGIINSDYEVCALSLQSTYLIMYIYFMPAANPAPSFPSSLARHFPVPENKTI
jgi:hypothetical protein